MMGAAVATAAAYVALFVGMTINSQHVYPVPYQWRRVLTLSGVAIALTVDRLRAPARSRSRSCSASSTRCCCCRSASTCRRSARASGASCRSAARRGGGAAAAGEHADAAGGREQERETTEHEQRHGDAAAVAAVGDRWRGDRRGADGRVGPRRVAVAARVGLLPRSGDLATPTRPCRPGSGRCSCRGSARSRPASRRGCRPSGSSRSARRRGRA